jgi:hypothetical protein
VGRFGEDLNAGMGEGNDADGAERQQPFLHSRNLPCGFVFDKNRRGKSPCGLDDGKLPVFARQLKMSLRMDASRSESKNKRQTG